MALNTSALQVGAAAIASDIDGLTLHTGDPGSAGTDNQTTAGKESVTASASGGEVTVPSTSFTGGAASGACTHVALWAGSTFRGAFALTGDQTFNAAGEYTVTSVTVTGSAS